MTSRLTGPSATRARHPRPRHARRSRPRPRAGSSSCPSPGATATLIHDLRELFKVKVVGMVLVTGWGGFYLASMQSGISSVQPGLLDALFGIGLVSAGAGALNEALERKTDARMIRTAQRPLACGRFSLAKAFWQASARLSSAQSGCSSAPICSLFHWRCSQPSVTWPSTPAQALHHTCHLHRRVSRRHGSAAWLDRRPPSHRVARRRPVRHPLCLAVSPLYGHLLALS